MARIRLGDRVKHEGVSITGIGNFWFSGATVPTGFQAFTDLWEIDGYLTPLSIVDTATGDWEVGYYEYDSAGPEFLRNSGASYVVSSSNAGGWVSFTAGANKDVAVVDTSQNVELLRNINSSGAAIYAVAPQGAFIDSPVDDTDVGALGLSDTNSSVFTVNRYTTTSDDTSTPLGLRKQHSEAPWISLQQWH